MKKILSVVLCVTMLASLFFVVPASAITNQEPYLLNDFENGQINMAGSGSHHKVELVEGGAFGSDYAAKVTADDRNYGSGLYKYGTTSVFSFNAHEGDTLYGSMLVKVTKAQAETSPAQCSLILWSGQKIESSSYQFVTTTFDKTDSDWQRVNFSYRFKKDLIDDAATTDVNEGIKNMEFRMNGASKNNEAADGTTVCEYLIDDMELYLKKNDGTIKHASGFETNDVVTINTNGDKYITEKVTTQAHTGSQSTKITVKNAAGMYNDGAGIRNNGSNLNIAMKDGMTVNISAYVKLDQALAENSSGKIGFLTYIDPYVDFDGDGTAGNNYKFFEVFIPDVTNTTDWQKVSTSFEWKYGETTLTSWAVRFANENILPNCTIDSPGTRIFYIDDMVIEAKYGAVNGYEFGFESGSKYKLNTNSGNYTTEIVSTEKHSGASSSLVTVANKSGMYSQGAYFRNDSSHLNIPVTDGDTVCISAYVKLAQALDPASNGKIGFLSYISPYVDFDGDGQAKNNYNFYILQIPDVTNTTDWQKVSTTFNWSYGETTLTSWELRLDNNNYLPGGSASAPGERKFYVDDIKIDIRDASSKESSPEISNVRESGSFKAGNTVGVKYEFDVPGAATDTSIIKLMAGNGTVGDCVARIAPGGTVTITEDMLGKNYYWEIIPKSSAGYIGEKVTLLATKPEFADIRIYNFEDGDDLDVAGAAVTNSGSAGTKGLSVTADSVTISTVIDPGFDYKVSAKVKATGTPTASFAMSDSATFTNSAMTVTALGDNWYSLTLDSYNFNTANNTSYVATQIVANAKITFGASGSYVLDDITFMPAEMTEIAGTTVTLPQSAQIFDTVNATVSKEASVFYVFEISADGTNWTTIDTGLTSKATIPYYMYTEVADKKLRVTIYTDGVGYEYKTSNVLTENTQGVVSTKLKITNASGEEVEDVTDGFLTATATVYNPSETPATITLYNAVYSTVPFKLAYLDPMAVTAPKGVTVVTDTVDLTDVSHYSEYTHCLKTFLWNGYTPLTDAVETQAAELIDGAVYNMYIDPSIQTVEGIVLANRHGESGAYTESDAFRAFCKERNLAIFNFYDGSNGQLKWFHNEEFAMNVLNTKIAEFAQSTGHPELNYAPFATLGHSNGCYSAAKIAQLNPERTFAVLCFKAAYGNQFEYDEIINAGIPVFAITGENDWSWGYHDQIHSAERMVAQDAIVTYVQQPNAGHGNMVSAEDMMLAFLDEAYKAKVQNATVSNGKVIMTDIDVESGYIGYGDYTEEVKSVWIAENSRNEERTVYEFTNPQYMTYAEYKTKPADFKVQAWLFNESFAQKWANFINTGSVN